MLLLFCYCFYRFVIPGDNRSSSGRTTPSFPPHSHQEGRFISDSRKFGRSPSRLQLGLRCLLGHRLGMVLRKDRRTGELNFLIVFVLLNGRLTLSVIGRYLIYLLKETSNMLISFHLGQCLTTITIIKQKHPPKYALNYRKSSVLNDDVVVVIDTQDFVIEA